MTEKRKVVGKNGVVRHVPIEYNKQGGGAVTISVSIRRTTNEKLSRRAIEQNTTKSKIVDNILDKELR